jgi:uncharacterized metal-binding protein YceD (DUF177 family)
MPAEFTRPFRLSELADTPEHKVEIVATAAERNALAARYSLLSLDTLAAQLTVRSDVSGEVVVDGHLQAEIVQECVVTLEPVSETVASRFEQRYTPLQAHPVTDLVIGPDDIEPPEPTIGDSIDLGELVAQFLSLAMNPYPRAADADAQADQYRADGPPDGPFAALAKLREQDQS